MKVAILSCDNSRIIKFGGKHVHQNLLERGLRHIGVDVECFYPDPVLSKFDLLKKILKAGPLSIFSKEKRFKANIKRFLTFFSNIQLSRFDIIHCHDVVAAYGALHENVVLTLHGYLARETINYMKKNISEKTKSNIYNFLYNMERDVLPKVKHIIAVDNRIKSYIIEEFDYPSEKITVIFNAVDTDLFSPVSEAEKINLREKLGIPTNAFVVLVPRRYVKKNGVTYAAEAFKKIKSNDFFFIFVGGGTLKKEIEMLLIDNNNKLILDGIPNEKVHEYYKASDVILIPSVTSDGVEEATSLSMLEGMACGKITICTNIGGMKEIIKHEENGLLIEQANPNAIIDSIIFAKDNYVKLESIRETARKYVVNNHSYIKHAKQVMEVYMRVINK